jgi:Mg2+ and Co2+ transporter CorA
MITIYYNILVPLLIIIIPTFISIYLYLNHPEYTIDEQDVNIDNINDITWDELKTKIDVFQNNMNDTTTQLYNIDIRQLKHIVYAYSKNIIFLKIKLLSISENVDYKKKYKDFDIYLKNINKMEQVNNYLYNYIYKLNHRDFIKDYSSIIQIIFLPLCVLVGYYGMNFKSMGSPALKNGVFSMPNGQLFVTGIVLVLVIIYSLVIYRYN